MYRITYSSIATKVFDDADLGNLLLDARANHERLGVTGALLYRDGRFLHVMEGPEGVVRDCYERIAADPRHSIQEMVGRSILIRRFSSWTMGYPESNGTFKLLTTDHDNPYDSLPLALESFGGEDRAAEPFDRLYRSWFAPRQGRADESSGESWSRREKIPQASPAPDHGKYDVGSTDLVNAIVDRVIADIRFGLLRPGDRLNGAEFAEILGTSRPPVREAIHRLREIGVVEVTADSFTRISTVDRHEAANHISVCIALSGLLFDEVIGCLDVDAVEGLRSDRSAFIDAVQSGDTELIAGASDEFFMRLVDRSNNAILKKSIHSLALVIRLAGIPLDELVGLDTIVACMGEIISASHCGDVSQAKQALNMFARLNPDRDHIGSTQFSGHSSFAGDL